jgi:hypothetical protein
MWPALHPEQQQNWHELLVVLLRHQAANLLLHADTASRFACGSVTEAKEAFLQQHGSSYGYQGWMEQHWQAEVGDRLGQGQHYLDYTGAKCIAAGCGTAVPLLVMLCIVSCWLWPTVLLCH